ncbi:serine protease HtrA [Sporanaerobium hydrogeniformans]|uniref:Serine protease HtrA n=2 Tax=Sporanaerobium hydrogeniformans TaxID=3072179 RepID=A0AC61DA66_9FIRM|nr:serine protease HtrA [Sporanaerobium hydrogeniformans]
MLSMLTLTAFGFGGGYAVGQFANPHSTLNTTPSVSSSQNDTVVQTASRTSGKALSVTEIANLNGNSVVEITTEVMVTGRRLEQYISQGAGSGVIITNDGYIMTNNHVISGSNKINVRLKNGETYEAKLIGTDPTTDIAVIKIEAKNLVPVTFGNSDKLAVGELAVAIGNPLGELGGTVTDGIISALDREITIDGETMNLLQTNAAINPGNSGGGLFNDGGELIGLVVAKSSGSDIEGLGFAIPSNDVKTVVDELIAHGYVTGRPALGVSLLDITTAQEAMMYRVNQTGVYVAQVSLDSAADKAGFKVGDCILSVNDTQITSTTELKKAILEHKVGDKLKVKILRDREEMTLEPVLKESNPSN